MSARIVTCKGFVAGWLDISLPELLDSIDVSHETRWAVISTLDSQPNPASLLKKSPELRKLAKQITVLGDSLLLRAESLFEANRQSPLFFGFDEVWLFPDEPLEDKPEGSSIVGPGRLSSKRLRPLGSWLEANRCSLGLGGGEGVNFVVPAHGLARDLLGCTLKQSATAAPVA
ncbi:MAG: hypothetical protein K2X38_16930 [Gemmataceae bacterium]|nr:hypothetical protein [Gemmataceae bacterium]